MIFGKNGSIVENHKISISLGFGKFASLCTQNSGLKQEK